MPRTLPPLLALALSAVLGATSARAVIVGGGGSASSDCLAVFDAPVNFPVDRPRNVNCTDGDASCDADGTVNGHCDFSVAMCANSTADPRCTLNGVQSITIDHAFDNGDPKFDPDFQGLQQRIDGGIDPPTTTADSCSTFAIISVPVLGPLKGNVCRRSSKRLRVTTVSTPMSGRQIRDTDRLRLTCNPAPAGCDPMVFFSGTFDRIQKQVFTKSCALSGCHDSQTHQGNLRLEDPAYANVVDVTPSNQEAIDAGWKRITPNDTTTSFLYRKVTGDLPDPGFGERMPRTGRNVDDDLINIIKLWIEAGAPETGWVPGTF